jgi:hypothetical protein
MRLMIVIFVLLGLFIVDRYRFGGYYSGQLSLLMERTIRSVASQA